MLYGLTDSNSKLLLRLRIGRSECELPSRTLCLPPATPVMMVGYYFDAPVFMMNDREVVEALQSETLVIRSTPEGPNHIFLDPHVDPLMTRLVSVSPIAREVTEELSHQVF